MTVVIFIIILAILVLVHECGHFVAAKLSGIRVDEFGLGFPPRATGFKKGETTYSLNWIPFGGFVKIFGEDGETGGETDGKSVTGRNTAASNRGLTAKNPRSFANKPKWIQAIVLITGILFNIIFAWLVLSLGFAIGMPVPQDYSLSNTTVANVAITITSVDTGSPAAKAGLQTGDAILGLSSGSDHLLDYSIGSVQDFVASHPNQVVAVTYRRGSKTNTTSITPLTGLVPGKAAIGVSLDLFGILKLPWWSSLWQGLKLTWAIIEQTTIGLAQFFYQAVTGTANLSEVTGPVGIAGLVGQAASLGFVYLLTFIAFISINLAIINLIPFPALDGGRLLFVLIEKIKGSAINPKVASSLNTIGFALLIVLMIVVTYHDVINLIH
jgi:regulator of sigma E protease